MTKRTLSAAVTAICLSAPLAAAPIEDFSSLIVFGDSLSDTGNALAATGGLYPPPPYFNGRFSDGPNHVDAMAQAFGAAGRPTVNLAFGGASAVKTVPSDPLAIDVPDFEDQRLIFNTLPAPVVGPRPLGLVFFGGNDIFSATTGNTTPAGALADAIAAADEVKTQIALFDELAINDFLLLNIGDVGSAPRYSADVFPDGAGGVVPNPLKPLQPVASAATDAFNARLSLNAQMLREAGRNIIEVDAASGINEIVADPTRFGFADATTSCGVFVARINNLPFYDFTRTACDVTDPASRAEYIWWDDVHLTSEMQGRLAALTLQTLAAAPVPVPAPIALLAGGLLLLAGLRRRA